VLVGEEDVGDMQAIAAHVAASVPGARLVPLPGTAHLPSLELPGQVDALLLEFLGRGFAGSTAGEPHTRGRALEVGPEGVRYLAFGAGGDPTDAEVVQGWWSGG